MNKKEKNWIRLMSAALALIVIFSFAIGYFIGDDVDCQGIGGFVYQEIEWGQQTYNVLTENCQRQGSTVVPMLFFDYDANQFFCYQEYDCEDNNCRTREYHFPIIIDVNN